MLITCYCSVGCWPLASFHILYLFLLVALLGGWIFLYLLMMEPLVLHNNDNKDGSLFNYACIYERKARMCFFWGGSLNIASEIRGRERNLC